jgi:hypothetical protein
MNTSVPISPVREAIFTRFQCGPDRAKRLHGEVESLLEKAMALFKIRPTKNREKNGNKVLTRLFEMEAERAARTQRHQRENEQRLEKQAQKRENPDIVFGLDSWTDRHGKAIKVGDTIRFMTLYGYRTAVVRSMEEDIRYNNSNVGLIDVDPVILVIDPFQPEGFEDVFKPCSRIEAPSLWNPEKYGG